MKYIDPIWKAFGWKRASPKCWQHKEFQCLITIQENHMLPNGYLLGSIKIFIIMDSIIIIVYYNIILWLLWPTSDLYDDNVASNELC